MDETWCLNHSRIDVAPDEEDEDEEDEDDLVDLNVTVHPSQQDLDDAGPSHARS